MLEQEYQILRELFWKYINSGNGTMPMAGCAALSRPTGGFESRVQARTSLIGITHK
jgi:hypothetical protein